MKIFKKQIPILLLVVFLVMSLAPAASAAPRSIDYVALGDSIAAGVIYDIPSSYPLAGSEMGYPYKIKEKLEGAGFTVNFNAFCQAGMTAKELADASALFSKNPAFINADLVTLDVGANDLLSGFYSLVEAYPGIQNSTEPVVIAAFQAKLAIVLNEIVANLGTIGKTVQANIETILQNVLKANPKAKIYVMGYYNPLPVLKNYGKDLTLPVIYFNTFIYRAISNVRLKYRGASISYIDTVAAMSDALNDGYLVPVDIHPTEAGHKMIAGLFWQRIRLDYLLSRLF